MEVNPREYECMTVSSLENNLHVFCQYIDDFLLCIVNAPGKVIDGWSYLIANYKTITSFMAKFLSPSCICIYMNFPSFGVL